MATPVLIISGPVGVGKTSVSEEVSNLLLAKNISHTLIDVDALAETYPRPIDDRFGTKLTLKNLSDIWKNCLSAGSKNLILARVIETENCIEEFASTLPNTNIKVCQLSAQDSILRLRVRKREIGSGLEWHEKRSLELAASLAHKSPANFKIETDNKTIVEIANEIFPKVSWAN